MEQPPPLRADPEFRPALTERTLRTVVDPAAYRRILANPFLGFLGLICWIGLVRRVIVSWDDRPALALPSLLAVALSAFFLPRLFRFQCLDCGRTGRIARWRAHVCPAVAARIVSEAPRRFRGPTPLAQTLAWAFVLAAVVSLLRVSGITLR